MSASAFFQMTPNWGFRPNGVSTNGGLTNSPSVGGPVLDSSGWLNHSGIYFLNMGDNNFELPALGPISPFHYEL